MFLWRTKYHIPNCGHLDIFETGLWTYVILSHFSWFSDICIFRYLYFQIFVFSDICIYLIQWQLVFTLHLHRNWTYLCLDRILIVFTFSLLDKVLIVFTFSCQTRFILYFYIHIEKDFVLFLHLYDEHVFHYIYISLLVMILILFILSYWPSFWFG